MIFTFLKMALNFIEKKISGDSGIRTHELENFLNLHEIYGEAANFLLEPTSCLSIFKVSFKNLQSRHPKLFHDLKN